MGCALRYLGALTLSICILLPGCGDDEEPRSDIGYLLKEGWILFQEPNSGRPPDPPEALEGEFLVAVVGSGESFRFQIERLRFRSETYSVRGSSGLVSGVEAEDFVVAIFEAPVMIKESEVDLYGQGSLAETAGSVPVFSHMEIGSGDGFHLEFCAIPEGFNGDDEICSSTRAST